MLREQIDFFGSVMRVTGIKLGERVRPLRPVTDPRVVPSRVEQLTTEWLTGALCAKHPGAAVTAFSLGDGSNGTSSRRGLTVAYNDAGTAAGLPTAIYTKSTPSLSTGC